MSNCSLEQFLHLTIPPATYEGSNFSILFNPCYCLTFFFIIIAILVDVKWYVIVIFWKNNFFYLFMAVPGLRCCLSFFFSLVVASGGFSLLWCAGFSSRWLLLLQSTGSRVWGFQQLWHVGLVAPFLDQEFNPCLLHGEADSLPLGHQGSPHCDFDLHFCNDQGGWAYFNVLIVFISFQKCLLKLFANFKIQFSSVSQLCPTLCDHLDCSTPGLPVHHQLPEFTQLMSIESVMPSNLLILCPPVSSQLQSFPAPVSLQMSQFFAVGGQSIGASASTSVLRMNIQVWFPLGWTSWISLQSKGLRVFSNTTVQKHQFFGTQLSL